MGRYGEGGMVGYMVYSFALSVKGFSLKFGVTRESYVDWPSISPGTGTTK